MAIIYRAATNGDLEPAMEVVYQGVNDLAQRHGFEGLVNRLTPEFHAFSLEDDPDGLWVAEEGGEVIGLGFSWVTDRFWFLADLFILPEYQGRGVGGELLQRTLAHAQKNHADNLALITFAYNTASIGLYAKQGLFPREPLYTFVAPSETLVGRVKKNLAWRPLDKGNQHAALLAHIDASTLGFSREKHHRFLLGDPTMNGFLLEDEGSDVAYVYISSDGHIGPLGVISHTAMGPAFNTALALAIERGTEQVSAFLAGRNEGAVSIALKYGMRLSRTMVLMSTKAFGDWARYAPNHPGFM